MRINTFDKFNESENTKRFVGPNGEFQPTEQPKEGTTTIQFMKNYLNGYIIMIVCLLKKK